MRHLNGIDYGVIVLYFAILLVMGFWLRRLASRSIEDYFLARRQLPWWMLGISGMGSFIDMAGTMIITSFLFMLGPRGLFVEFRGGACLVLVFMTLWTGKWHRRSNCMTVAEWNIYRFGERSGAQAARIITALSTFVFSAALLAYLIKGAGLFLSMYMPFSPGTCALIMVSVTVVYTMLSGFYGVVYTDMFQCFIIVAAVVVISVIAAARIAEYPGDLGELAGQVTGNSQWMSSIPHAYTTMPKGYEEFQPLLYIGFLYLLKSVIIGLGSGGDPRYFGARNERECGLLSFFWTWLMAFRWPMMMAFVVLGVFLVHGLFPDQKVISDAAQAIKQHHIAQAYPGQPDKLNDPGELERIIPASHWEDVTSDIIYHPENHEGLAQKLQHLLGDRWTEKLYLVGYHGTVNPERILPAVLIAEVNPGLRGLFIVALLAAAMSTFSPTVNTCTAMFTRDLYQAFIRKAAGNRELIGASYAFSVALTAASFGMAYRVENINEIWDWIIMGLLSGTTLPLALRLYWWRFNASGVVIGTTVGLVAALLQWFLFPDWGPEKKFFVITAIAGVSTIIGTYLTKPTDWNVLVSFYRTTRPFGLWGPLKRTLSAGERASMNREHFYDIISTPFAFFWQVTLFLLPMQVVIGAWRSFWPTLGIFLVSLAGMYWFWYRNLPPATCPADSAQAEA